MYYMYVHEIISYIHSCNVGYAEDDAREIMLNLRVVGVALARH